jgi:membrane-associated protease RseP (regulator of RpoE activity)
MADFFTEVAAFFMRNWDVIIFYALVVILLYIFRSKFEFQGIIALFRTKFGLAFMTNTGKRWPRFWHVLGLVSVILCFLIMIAITIYLFYGLYALFFVPNAPPTLSPVIPGVEIPGSPIAFPLWYTLIGLFFAVIIHEAAHGVWSAAYNIKIKSSGFAFFGPLPGAFVEPDEKVLVKRPAREQLAIFSAGPFVNILLGFLALGLAISVALVSNPLITEAGVSIEQVADNSSAALAGLPEGTIVSAIDTTPVRNTTDFVTILESHSPGDTILVTADEKDYSIVLGSQPTNASQARLGVSVKAATEAKNPSLWWLVGGLTILFSIFWWTYVISIGLGTANLIPIGPIDGGRMFYIALLTKFSEKKAKKIWTNWSWLLLIMVLILVFVPIIKAML